MEYIPSVERTPIYVRPWDVPQSTHIHGGALLLRGKMSATIMLRQSVLTDTCDQHGYSQNAEQQRRIAHQRHGMAFGWRSSTQKMQVRPVRVLQENFHQALAMFFTFIRMALGEQSSVPSKSKTFGSLGLSSALVRSLSSLRITSPTPIQGTSIPQILQGHDLIGGSPTGSGKTLSFALPILQKLMQDMAGGYAVVLTPTRELALQLHEQFVAVGEGAKIGLRVALVVGGLDIVRQSIELSKSRLL